jgi:TRAP transporter TAXI family solute receptor
VATAGDAMDTQSFETRADGRMRAMLRHTWLVGIGGALALAGLIALAFYFTTQPTILKIAVAPPNSEDVRVIQAIAQLLARDRASIRLRTVVKDNVVDSAAALDRGEVDLAVARRDRAMPQSGQAVAILRRNLVVLVAPPPAPAPAAKAKRAKKSAKEEEPKKIEKIEELSGRRIAVIGRSEANVNLLNIILKQYDIAPDKVQVVQLDTTDVGPAIRESKVDAIMSVGPVGSRITTDAVAASSRDKEAPTFLAIDASEAIVQRNPVYESTEIPAGAFGGAPQRPSEAVETIGFNHYILARKSLDETTVGDFARLLFGARQTLPTELPSAAKIEAPETDKDAAVPVHPGAAAYIDGEQKNFFERYNDWIYYGLMIFSFLGSALAWLMNYSKSDDRVKKLNVLDRLIELLKAARMAADVHELEGIQAEADDILQGMILQIERGEIDPSALQAFTMALDQARSAVADRRAALLAGPGEAEATSLWHGEPSDSPPVADPAVAKPQATGAEM